MKKLIICTLWVLGWCGTPAFAQIQMTVKGKAVEVCPPKFSPAMPLPGAPAPHRNYFWIFSDGTFSQDSAVEKSFAQPGTYDVLLYTTDSYSTGGPPPPVGGEITMTDSVDDPRGRNVTLRPEWVVPLGITSNRSLMLRGGRSLHALVPDEPTILVVSYGNPGEVEISEGELRVDFELPSRLDSLVSLEAHHAFHGERLQDREEEGNPIRIHYENLQPGEQRNLFLVISTQVMPDSTFSSPEIPMKVTHSPSGDTQEVAESSLWLTVAEDPNRIRVDRRVLPWRKRNPNWLEYTVEFQNVGMGPANNIQILVQDEQGALDFSRIEVVSWYPPAPKAEHFPTSPSLLHTQPQKDGNGATFLLHNVYLPGLNQPNDVQEDSTMGYVTFRVPTSRVYQPMAKVKAVIKFDLQKAIETRPVRTRLVRDQRLKVAVAPQLMAKTPGALLNGVGEINSSEWGWNVQLSLEPFQPKGWYWLPQVSVEQLSILGDNGRMSWLQIGGSPFNAHRKVAEIVRVGLGVNTHFVLSTTEQYVPSGGGDLVVARGWPIVVGSYLHAEVRPFRRGLAAWGRIQHVYADYLAPTSISPHQLGAQMGLSFTF